MQDEYIFTHEINIFREQLLSDSYLKQKEKILLFTFKTIIKKNKK